MNVHFSDIKTCIKKDPWIEFSLTDLTLAGGCISRLYQMFHEIER